MTGPLPRDPAAVCARKKRLPDELTARAKALHAIEVDPDVDELYPYRCTVCHGWHLTRFPQANHPAVVAGNPIHMEA